MSRHPVVSLVAGLAFLSLAACGAPPGVTGSCDLSSEYDACNECYSGDTTCTYGEYEVTEASCDGCQARSALYREMCADGVTDTRDEIQAGEVCTTE